MGKLYYMVPIYSLANNNNLQKLHKVIMTAARAAIGNFCFRKSIQYILTKGKWFDIHDWILSSTLNTLHRTLHSVHSTLHTIHRTLNTLHSSLNSNIAHYILYISY